MTEIVSMDRVGPCYVVELDDQGNTVAFQALAATVNEDCGLVDRRGVEMVLPNGTRRIMDVEQAAPLAVALLATVSHAHGGVTLTDIINAYADEVSAMTTEEQE